MPISSEAVTPDDTPERVEVEGAYLVKRYAAMSDEDLAARLENRGALPEAAQKHLDQELIRRGFGTSNPSTEAPITVQEVGPPKAEGGRWASLFGWILIVVGIVGGMSRLSRGSRDGVSSFITAATLIVLGIGLTRNWSWKRTGIVLAAVWLPAIAMAVVTPKLTGARLRANEMAATKQIETIHTAQTYYFSQFGTFAGTLAQLGPPQSGTPGPAGAGLIPGDLAQGEKTGYKFSLTASKAGYTITAVPTANGQTGRRTFFSDQSLEIRENWGAGLATANSGKLTDVRD